MMHFRTDAASSIERSFRLGRAALATAAVFAVSASGHAAERSLLPNMFPQANASGLAATFSTSGYVDLTGPFFQQLGTNGRACVTCHQPRTAWAITPAHVQARFEQTKGKDPLFRAHDGANSPLADVSTVKARRDAYSMLL